MKIYSPATIAALEAGDVITVGAVRLAIATPWRVWGGYGDLTLDGEVYTGLGDNTLVNASAGTLGGSEQGATLTLSGVDPDVISLIDANDVRGSGVILWRLIFDGSGVTLLDAKVHLRGRVDQMPIKETVGGTATLSLQVEGAARGLGRKLGRMRTDSDQRMISGEDGGFRNVSIAAEKTLYWGGKPPQRTGAALPGSSGASGVTGPRLQSF